MTNTPKLAIAIGYIDDDLVTGAAEYMPKKKAYRCILHKWPIKSFITGDWKTDLPDSNV